MSGARRDLLIRGFWRILIELTVVRVASNSDISMFFNAYLGVIWVIGLCMVCMAGLIGLPRRATILSSAVSENW